MPLGHVGSIVYMLKKAVGEKNDMRTHVAGITLLLP